ncbi:MAG TPA: type IX secretion system membrane protein PorP/SprF [Chryseosolibacter sp.]
MIIQHQRRLHQFLFLVVVVVLLTASRASAQLDPLYAQYFNTPILINPAFTGMHNRWVSSAGYRGQWTGLEGAPNTMNFNSHISLRNNTLGAGIMFLSDRIGENRNKEFNALMSYRIELNEGVLSFGMQAGMMQFSSNSAGVVLRDPSDPKFATFNEFKFNTGAGLVYQTDKYMFGLSVPRLLNNDITLGTTTIQVYDRHYYVIGSYTLPISARLKMVPTVLLKATKANPISADINANIVIDDIYTAGICTRNLNSFGLTCTMRVKNYRFGYIFEVPGSNPGTAFTTHEVTMALGIPIFNYHEKIFQKF